MLHAPLFSKLMPIRRYFIPYKILDATKCGLYKTQNKDTIILFNILKIKVRNCIEINE
jgi:hypothetical protein